MAGTDGVSSSKAFVFTSRLDAGKHLETIRSVSQTDSWLLAPNRALRSLLPGHRNGAEQPGGLAAILAKRSPSVGLVLGGLFPFPGIHPSRRAATSPLLPPSLPTSAPRSAGDGLTPPALVGVRIPLRIGYRSPGGDATLRHEALFRQNSRTRSQSFDSQIHI